MVRLQHNSLVGKSLLVLLYFAAVLASSNWGVKNTNYLKHDAGKPLLFGKGGKMKALFAEPEGDLSNLIGMSGA